MTVAVSPLSSVTSTSEAFRSSPLEARAVTTSEAVPVISVASLVVTFMPVRPSIVFRSPASSDAPATVTVN